MEDFRARVRSVGLPELQWVQVATGPMGPIFAFWAPGKDAVDRWRSLRPHVSTIGYPLILGSDEDLDRLRQSMGQGPREIGIVDAFDPAAWFAGRLTADDELMEPDELAKFEQSIHGPWPNTSPSNSFQVPFDLVTHKPVKKLWVGILPIAQPWEAAPAIEYGSWNECPSPEEHAAVMRYWSERWGAEPVVVASDTVEMLVHKPPHTRDEALALANEQFAYCGDIVTQGVGTIEALAATLLEGQTWFFWWD
jgi:hypothetical protein